MPAVERPHADPLSVPEMLRIMDVATALRLDREVVEEQLNQDALRVRLRERMLAAAAVSGDAVTPEEIDAAITQYYQRLNAYQEPPLGFETFLAHVYVRRVGLLKWACAVGFWALVWWWVFGPITPSGRANRELTRLSAEVSKNGETARAVAADPEAAREVQATVAEAETYRKQGDATRLREAAARLARLDTALREEYRVSVVSGSGKKSAVDRYYRDQAGKRVSGYYLIVEARGPNGEVVTKRVRNSETGKEHDARVWAERVPKEVYDRLARDKKADGVLDETAFAVKTRGRLGESVVMPGADGQPLAKLGQITEW